MADDHPTRVPSLAELRREARCGPVTLSRETIGALLAVAEAAAVEEFLRDDLAGPARYSPLTYMAAQEDLAAATKAKRDALKSAGWLK